MLRKACLKSSEEKSTILDIMLFIENPHAIKEDNR